MNQVEKLGEFVSYKAVVIITDNDSELSMDEFLKRLT